GRRASTVRDAARAALDELNGSVEEGLGARAKPSEVHGWYRTLDDDTAAPHLWVWACERITEEAPDSAGRPNDETPPARRGEPLRALIHVPAGAVPLALGRLQESRSPLRLYGTVSPGTCIRGPTVTELMQKRIRQTEKQYEAFGLAKYLARWDAKAGLPLLV